MDFIKYYQIKSIRFEHNERREDDTVLNFINVERPNNDIYIKNYTAIEE